MMLDVTMLGQFEVQLHGEPVDLTSRPLRLLMAYLMLHAGQTLSRAKVAGVLWPDSMESAARKNLRNYVWRLRQTVGEVYVAADKNTVAFDPSVAYHLDVETLERGTGEGSTEALIEAVSAYRGELLPGHYEEWVQLERGRLRAVFEQGMQSLLERLAAEKRWSELVIWSEHWIAFGETPEPAYRSLMTGYAGLGDLAGVARAYRRCAQALEEELGVEPAPETQALYEAIREGQLAEASTSIARAEPKARKELGRLPSPATPFVGRQKELSDVAEQLAGGCRLLTLLGPGGSGKTRLAVEVARRHVDNYAYGAAFVDLAPLSDAAAIPAAISTALDFRFTAEGSPREQILNYLANKELLLVLDNFEHLLDGAKLVDDLLETAPGVCLIATSRARLNLGSECLFEIGGLKLPEDGVEAVEMFMEYARRVRPGFELEEGAKPFVGRICRLVEGMPLAIELAAPWVRYLSPAAIAEELGGDLDFLESTRADLPARQRSMRAAFDHSWNLLDEDGRDALMKLSVFRGGASREAASAVTGAPFRTLVDLADHSLLGRDPASGRFAIHELIRQFAMERLEDVGESKAVRDAHSDYYLQALGGRLPELQGRDQLRALDAIEGDFENVRAAWRWADRQGRWQHVAQASQSLFLFALFRSRYQDGVELFEAAHSALPSPSTLDERLARAYTLAGGQGLLSFLGLYEEALAAVPELKATLNELADPAAVAYCQLMMGHILIYGTVWGETPSRAAIAALGAARDYFQQTKDPFYSAMALWRLGLVHSRAGHREKSRDFYRRGLALAREMGDRFVAALLLHNLGVLEWTSEGPTEVAEGYFAEARNLLWEIGAPAYYAFTSSQVAHITVWREGNVVKRRPLLKEALAIAAEQNSPFLRADTLATLATYRLLEGRYENVLALTEEALLLVEKNMSTWCLLAFQRSFAFLAVGDVEKAIPFMKRGLSWARSFPTFLDLQGFLAYCGVLMAGQSEHGRATELLALGLTSHHRGGMVVDPLITRTRAELEETLGQEAFAAAWERGKELDPLAVAEEVLEAMESLESAA